MTASSVTRRKLLRDTALATTALIAAPYVRSSYAAGKLSVGFWDHWVPGANDTLTKLCNEWAAKEKVDITIDYITSQGDKILLTIAAEAQAGSGHDLLQQPNWQPSNNAEKLEPVDDIVHKLIEEHGKPDQVVEYLGKVDGHWIAVPATTNSLLWSPCARIDLFKEHVGLDLREMYPAGAPPNAKLAAEWTWDTFRLAAEKCFKAGYPFGMPLGQTTDSVAWVGAVFGSYGAQLVDEKGEITVNSDATRQVLEWFKKIVPFFPADVFAWDDSSNNKWLISGKGALIMNPPSAWAVAVRDAPKVAEQCWTFASPEGPKGRYTPGQPSYLGIWKFSPNKSAAKSLATYLSRRASVDQLVAAGHGYDIPAFQKLKDFKTWDEEGPPKGTLYHYPARGDQIVWIGAAPAPPKIATQIFNQATMTKMIARMIQQGDSIDKVIAWAADECSGFMRT